MAQSELEEYKSYVADQLGRLSPLLQKYAMGDFSESISIPDKENEFTELLVGLRLMVDDIKELIQEKDSVIAERKRAEEALRQSEEKYRSLTENVNVGVYRNTAGAKGRFIEANRALVSMFGYETKEDFFRLNVADLYRNPAERKAFSDKLARQSFVKDEELQLVRRDGTLFWGAVSAVAVKDKLGRVEYYDGIIEDITDRKQAEDALRDSEREKETILESLFEHVIHEDTDMRILWANQAACASAGMGRNELVGRHCYEIWPQRSDVCPDCPVVKAMNTQQPEEVEKSTPDGRVWFIRGYPVHNEHGDVVGGIEVTLDITDRKRAEEALRESEGRNRAILNAFPDIMFVQDRSGRYLDYHAADTETLFVSPEDFLGKNVRDVFPETFASTILDLITRALRTGSAQIFEYPLPIADTMRHFEARLVPYGDDKVLSIIREITERKRAEEERDELHEQFLQAQKMEAIGVLASGVAHDFNNLLTTIIGNAQLMLGDLRKDDPFRENTEEIRRAGEKGAGLTRQLLIFSRKETFRPEVIDLNRIIMNIETMLRRTIGEDIELVLKPSIDLAKVMADPGQIEQVILNLVVNARDAMPQGGKLLIETANVELSSTYEALHTDIKPGSYVTLTVGDTGCGMESETLSRIFEPFFTTKERGKGTGLGLSTVYGIVKQSGGAIWVSSESRCGTTFKIYLPQTQAKEKVPTKPQKTEVQHADKHILVAEDEESVRGFMTRLLAKLGYRVSAAANAGEALLQVEEQGLRPDLLITDVVMPRMSGMVLTERLRRTYPDLKVLYMSGYPEDDVPQHGIFEPGTPFLQKPFSVDDISVKLQEIFSEKEESI